MPDETENASVSGDGLLQELRERAEGLERNLADFQKGMQTRLIRSGAQGRSSSSGDYRLGLPATH